ncbi:VOC family protein [Kribbella sp. NPDC004536]|uniref:VOC family protein n=1 Tax=Kribbella sp. NPDC004536 TaxID=3364106 RepID=UPI0036CC5B97
MSERQAYVPGTPCWVDLSTEDTVAAVDFYRGLLGWEPSWTEDLSRGVFRKGGKIVAGIVRTTGEDIAATWNTYITSRDLAATSAKVLQAGGQVLVPATAVLDSGITATFADLEGVRIRAWEPIRHHGAEIVNERGAWSWSELNTRDSGKAMAFYPDVFGWRPEENVGTAGYIDWRVGGKFVGGMMDMPSYVSPDVPPQWLNTFVVDDVDLAAKTVLELGGEQQRPFADFPTAGRVGIFSDVVGAGFALISGLTEHF